MLTLLIDGLRIYKGKSVIVKSWIIVLRNWPRSVDTWVVEHDWLYAGENLYQF